MTTGLIKDKKVDKVIPKAADDGYVEKTFEGFKECIKRLGYEFRINKLGNCIEYRIHKGKWRMLTDSMGSKILAKFEQFHVRTARSSNPWILSDNMFNRYIWAISDEVDLFEEYLKRIKRKKWDGTPRIHKMLNILFGAEGELAEWASAYIFMGILQRLKQPGAKLDEIPILIGEKGIGKSELCQYVLPPELNAHGDAVDLSLSDKDNAERTQYKLIVELSELVGVLGKDYNKLKTYISRTDDGQHRKAYGRNPEPSPRRFVFFGTTNDHRVVPNDPTGNRRLIPIELPLTEEEAEKRYPGKGLSFDRKKDFAKIHDLNVRKWLTVNLDELWREALTVKHPVANLPVDLRAAARDASEEHRDADDEIEARAETFLSINEKEGFVTSGQFHVFLHKDDIRKGTTPTRAETLKYNRVLELVGKRTGWKHGADRIANKVVRGFRYTTKKKPKGRRKKGKGKSTAFEKYKARK